MNLPKLIYGTAWKEETTSVLTQKAVLCGFKAIDTANQKKHYREDYVGDALLELRKKGISRESLFLQTKYTYQRGQDHRLPYDPNASFSEQVKCSFESSLKQLHTDYLDSFLMHGPYTYEGLVDVDWEVWETMEEFQRSGKVKKIGVSNFNRRQIEELFSKSKIKPFFVQNRCYANRGWDLQVREYCLENGIHYQGFSLLTANPHVWENPEIAKLAQGLKVTPAQLVLRFATQIGILPLTGTSDETHMKQDLSIFEFELSNAEMEKVIQISLGK